MRVIELVMNYNIGLLLLVTVALSSCDPSSNSDKDGGSNNDQSLSKVDPAINKTQDLQKNQHKLPPYPAIPHVLNSSIA